MIETVLMIWFSGWVLWMLSLIAMGDFHESFAGYTLSYALLPFVVVIAVLLGILALFAVPISVVFCKSIRDKIREDREKDSVGYNKEEV